MLKHFTYCLSLLVITCLQMSCNQQAADLIVYNAHIYTMDSALTQATAMAIKDGKIIAVGTDNELKNFEAKEKIDLDGKFVYPGFIDAHCHFYGYAIDLKKINLTGTTSWEAVLDTITRLQNQKFMGWIFGRGWDQNDWNTKSYPTKEKLDSLFPNQPVFLFRIDGHAAIVNQKALDLCGVTAKTTIDGGIVEVKNGKLTGLLFDNAVDLVKLKIPAPTREAEIEGLLQAQKNCFSVGLTTVDDAGLEKETILLIDSLQKAGLLKMRYYAMIAYNEKNKNYFFEKGKIKSDRLSVRSFKIYADGALGSRGALLIEPYSDEANHHGLALSSLAEIEKAATEIAEHDFQLCTHCIGDSGNRNLLKVYQTATAHKPNLRWRIEHAQVVHENDFQLFEQSHTIPSIQPTHATSDMYWAESRIGKERIKNAYAYKRLLQTTGIVAAGSDFPVEDINPLYGYYAAVVRKDKKNYPNEGFQKENALTRIEALRAMTNWAAYANFEENEKGSLEMGKFADFVVLSEDLMNAADEQLWQIKVNATYLNGEKVFEKK